MFHKKEEKVFCIGLNKTGTTTIEKVLRDFGYTLGLQSTGERLIKDWYRRDFDRLIKFCKSANAFQDAPFSFPFTYIFLDQYFKNAKFILTVRDSKEQWFNSLTQFHSSLWADGKRIPTMEDLKAASYLYPGYAYDVNQYVFGAPKDDPYSKEHLYQYYQNHNYSVIEYFKGKPEKLIVINVSKKDDYGRLCDFLERPKNGEDFPWENKTNNIK